MDALPPFLDLVKKNHWARGHFVGFLQVLIGRRLAREGEVLSSGLTWRDLAAYLKKVRWEPEYVVELGLTPDELPPRDRQRFWFSAITRARVDSDQAKQAGDLFAELLRKRGYEVS